MIKAVYLLARCVRMLFVCARLFLAARILRLSVCMLRLQYTLRIWNGGSNHLPVRLLPKLRSQ